MMAANSTTNGTTTVDLSRSTNSSADEPNTIQEQQLPHSMEEDTKALPTTVSSDNDDDDNLCPLFMETLPSDFANNPGLAAIASLLNSDEEEESTPKPSKTIPASVSKTPQAGGGKARRTSQRRRTAPYQKPASKKATVGEAQLFLKLWKI